MSGEILNTYIDGTGDPNHPKRIEIEVLRAQAVCSSLGMLTVFDEHDTGEFVEVVVVGTVVNVDRVR